MAPKKKQEKMTLGSFLSDQNYGSWAEEMEEMPLPSRGDARPSYGSGFGGDRRDLSGYSRIDRDLDRGPRDALPLPTRPPYTAHLGNLSFDVTMADVEDFLAGCEVTNVRIVEDKIERKPKGFGYVEFGTLDGLKKALELNSTQFQGRNIRISVAEPPKEREGAREITDWSRKGPLPELPANTRRPSGRGFEPAGPEAGGDRGARRTQAFESDGKIRDFGNWERKGPLSPPIPQAGSPQAGGRGEMMRRNDRSFDRRDSPSWGEGRPAESQDGSRAPRREFQERPPPVERAPTAAELDTTWRARMRPDAPVASQTPTPSASIPSSPVPTAAAPATRPKLNLTKRTVSEAVPDAPSVESGAGDAKASPFGAARPIDTATRDREIEDKRLAALKKKEEEDREREAKAKEAKEKAAAERAARGEKEPPSGPRENGRSFSSRGNNNNNAGAAGAPPNSAAGGAKDNVSGKATKENGGASTILAERPNFEILRRGADAETGEGEAGAEGVKSAANGDGATGAAVNVVDPAVADATTEANAAAPEGEGWETVPAKEKFTGRKRGGRGQGMGAGRGGAAS